MEDTFNKYCLPSGKIAESASNIHHLYHEGDKLIKRTNGSDVTLDAFPVRVVINEFWNWVCADMADVDNDANNDNNGIDNDGDDDVSVQMQNLSIASQPTQNLLIGYNNATFDDHRILINSAKYVEESLYTNIRKTIFTTDCKIIEKTKGSLQELVAKTSKENVDFHDAMGDCRAVASVLQFRHTEFKTLIKSCRSLESVLQKKQHPLLRGKLVTAVIARKITDLSCEVYLSMSDEELTRYMRHAGIKAYSIKICLSKRRKYIKNS